MRKQDRIVAQQQNRSPQHADDKSQPQSPPREQMKGQSSSEQPSKTQRQPGKMPLPD